MAQHVGLGEEDHREQAVKKIKSVAKAIGKLYGPSGGKTQKTVLQKRIKTRKKP